jgi:hypothetical protein
VGLQQECDVLRSILNEICETAEGLKTRSALLPDCSLYDLSNQVEYIFDDCFHGLELFKKATAQVELIRAMLGVQSGITTALPLIASQAAHTPLISLNQGKLEAPEDLSWFEAGAEGLVQAVANSEQIIKTAIQTGKSTQATVMLVTSMCGMAIDLTNQIILAPGMPLSQSSLVQDIQDISERNDEFLGLDGDIVDAYRKEYEIEEINERLNRD